MNVYLSGMIGSGKSALGERLAGRLGRPFVDLDREIDRALGHSFHRLVAERGWLAFRELEYATVKRMAAMRGVVAALGGGTVRYEWNRDAIHGSGVTVLLEADLATLAARVRADDRPRVNPDASLEDDLAAIWSSAGHLYHVAADVRYRTDAGRSVDEEVEDLVALLAPLLPPHPAPRA
jgi:shikimate kinase